MEVADMSNFIEGTNFMCSGLSDRFNFIPTITDFNKYREIKMNEILDMTIADISKLTINDIVKAKIENER